MYIHIAVRAKELCNATDGHGVCRFLLDDILTTLYSTVWSVMALCNKETRGKCTYFYFYLNEFCWLKETDEIIGEGFTKEDTFKEAFVESQGEMISLLNCTWGFNTRVFLVGTDIKKLDEIWVYSSTIYQVSFKFSPQGKHGEYEINKFVLYILSKKCG